MLRNLLKHRKETSSHHRKSGAFRRTPAGGPRDSLRRTDIGAGRDARFCVSTDDMLGCRYELKYYISESKAEAIAQFIKPYLHLDHYCKLQRSGSYPIVSLYLDSEDLRLCRQTLEGQKNRFKLRIRSYADDPDYPRFVEIKRRLNSIIIKTRARIKDHDVAAMLSGLSLSARDYEIEEEALGQFQFYVKHINAGPVMRVRYVRRAYEGDSENRVRVTLDRQLAYNVSSEPKVSFVGRRWQRHSLGAVILEIKFTACYPAWLSRMAECFNLRQQSISKYVSSVKQSCLMGFCAPRCSV